MQDYKSTLNLPHTDFPMKGNLQELEPKTVQHWLDSKLFQKIIEKNKSAATFTLHDGPPYANGMLHAGHALNKILKDVVVKYRNLKGQKADFIPGWDCHGLPIEQAVEKRLREQKIDKRTLSKDEFLEKCRAYALEFIELQKKQFQRMGVLGQFDAPYKTLSFDYEAQEIRELATFAKKKALYRKKKPVYWCVTDATALAEAEVEYEDHDSPSVYVAFRSTSDLKSKCSAIGTTPVDYVIWTTTPWTLPANLAICANRKFTYVFYKWSERVLIVAKDLLPKVLAEIAPDELQMKDVDVKGVTFDTAVFSNPKSILGFIDGEELEGLTYKHAFYDRESKIILGDHVTLDAGTGLVHTAPGHGHEDYVVGLEYKLDIYNPVKNDGRYDDSVGDRLKGQKVFDANPLVIEWLVENNALLNSKDAKVSHSYPHCWRCHNPIIYRATHQWFISLESNGLRQKALHAIDKEVNWVPKWGHDRIYGMLETRPDWCISRQRTWGVPIPIAICDGCDEAVADENLMLKVADAVEKEGTGVWYRTPVETFLPSGFACPHCKETKFRRETDILDVWFDSACSFAAVIEKREGQKVPVDLYLEGSDQHRGWFHSSLLVAAGTREVAPYKTCLTHGFVVDGDGKKMSKSLGNVVSPDDIQKKHGAEIMRMWVAASDYRDDVRLSNKILDGLAEGYRKIRNTIRYSLSTLSDFSPATDGVSFEKLNALDAWALTELQKLISKVTQAYESYEFHTVYHSIVDFCANELSAVYFDISKDPLYTSKKNGVRRRSAQTVQFEIAKALLTMLAPITSFTSDEGFRYLPGEKPSSVFLSHFPQEQKLPSRGDIAEIEKLLAVRLLVLPVIEVERRNKTIGKSLEARLVFSGSGEGFELLKKWAKELPEIFIVSQVEFSNEPSGKATKLEIGKTFEKTNLHVESLLALGTKCPRCWMMSTHINESHAVCERCEEALAS